LSVFYKRWIFGAHLCRILPLTQSVAVLVTSWSLTVIALDKFVHIIDATKEAVRLKGATGTLFRPFSILPFFEPACPDCRRAPYLYVTPTGTREILQASRCSCGQ